MENESKRSKIPATAVLIASIFGQTSCATFPEGHHSNNLDPDDYSAVVPHQQQITPSGINKEIERLLKELNIDTPACRSTFINDEHKDAIDRLLERYLGEEEVSMVFSTFSLKDLEIQEQFMKEKITEASTLAAEIKLFYDLFIVRIRRDLLKALPNKEEANKVMYKYLQTLKQSTSSEREKENIRTCFDQMGHSNRYNTKRLDE